MNVNEDSSPTGSGRQQSFGMVLKGRKIPNAVIRRPAPNDRNRADRANRHFTEMSRIVGIVSHQQE